MKPARAFLQLVLSVFLVAALVVSSGFAATKNLDRNRLVSEESNDSPLVNTTLLNTGSGVPSDGAPSLSLGSLQSSPLVSCPGGMDCWKGGTDNWSNAGKWSAGEPGSNSNVTIYSGGNDNVTLDTNVLTTINSLTLGGATNGTTSELTIGGYNNTTLKIKNDLTIGQTGYLFIEIGTVNPGDSTNAGTISLLDNSTLAISGNLTNSGTVQVDVVSVLTVTGDATNSGTIATSGLYSGSTITVNGLLTNEVGGQFTVGGRGDKATLGSLTNSGKVDLEHGSTLTINGNVSTSGQMYTDSQGGGGGNTLNITGNLNNSGTFQTFTPYGGGPGDMATISGNLTNSGTVDLEGNSKLTVSGAVDNSGTLETNGGNTLNVAGNLTNEVGGNFTLKDGDKAIISGNLTNSGTVNLGFGNTLTVTGAVDNFGTLEANFSPFGGFGVGNTVNVTGLLTNEAGGQFTLTGLGDMATIGSLVNSGVSGMRGLVDVENFSTLTIAGDVTNSGVMVTGKTNNIECCNTLTITGSLTNNWAFGLLGDGDLGSIDGNVTNNVNGQIRVANGAVGTIGGALTNSGLVGVENGSTLTISGNVDNSGQMYLDLLGPGGGSTLKINGNVDNAGTLATNPAGPGGWNTITINGTLTNEVTGNFTLNGPGDIATIGKGVTNNAGGVIDVEGGSTLNITGDVINNWSMTTTNSLMGGGNTINITGNLTNNLAFALQGLGDKGTISGDVTNTSPSDFIVENGATGTVGGSLNNVGLVDLEDGGTLLIKGDAQNSGLLGTSLFGGTGGNSLTIKGTLTTGGNGNTFELNGPGDMATFGSLSNASWGTVDVENGSTLNVTGDAINNGLMVTAGYPSDGGNTLNITGTLTNEASGTLELHGPGGKATLGSLSNAPGATVDLENGSTLTINGAADNSGTLETNANGSGGGNSIAISGMLVNEASGTFELYGPGDRATLGGLNNSGIVGLNNGSTLTIMGDATNTGTIETDPGGNTITVNGMLTNRGTFQLNGPGDMATLGSLTNNSGGLVDVENGSKLQINGDASNSSNLYTDKFGMGGNNTMNITGTLTNAGNFVLNGPGDRASIGGDMTNSYSVDLESQTTLTVAGNYNQQREWAGTTLNGTLMLMGGQANFNALTFLFGNGGTIIGNALMGGVIVPGTSLLTPGALNIKGNYTQTGSGVFALGIAGTGQCTGYSCLNITGSALLGGTLNIALLNGFFPHIGDTFTFLTADGGVDETFSAPTDRCDPGIDAAACIYLGGMASGLGANRQFELIYGENYVELETTEVVPEPATLLVLIPGLFGMGYGLRRKLLQ